MLKLVTVLLLVAAACSAAPSRALARFMARGKSRLNGRIIGGEPVEITQYPWQVALEEDGWINCGGSIISSNWVLTAGSCFDVIELLSIRAGSSFRESGGTVFNVSDGWSHEKYSPFFFDYDIAVLRIDGSFSFGPNMQAVSLTTSEPPAGLEVTITGWGLQASIGDLPEQLQAVTTHIVSQTDCNATYFGDYSERMICAGEPEGGKGPCRADGGGALVSGSIQYGIVSWGTGCAVPGFPGVFTNVAIFRSWISDNTGV